MSFTIHLQKTGAGYRVCLVSAANGKLVMQGETLNRRKDAQDIIDGICGQWNNNSVLFALKQGNILKPDHVFSKNSGPKKKSPLTPKKR